MIVGLTGLKGSGKDTVGAYLVKEHSFERRSFADPLKRSVAALFDIPMWEIEKWKNDDTVFVTVGNKNDPQYHTATATMLNGGIAKCDECGEIMLEDERHNHPISNKMWSPIREHSFREMLQRYGTESHRDIFGTDFWVDQALPVEGFYSGRSIVVTDVRFQNEAQRIKDIGGYVTRVLRPNPDIPESLHTSEVEQLNIKADFVIDNVGSMGDLYRDIEDMLDVITNQSGKWPGER